MQNKQIEQEFFKAFDYKPRIIVKYELDEGIFELPKSEYQELCKRNPINGKYVNYISEREVYPPITPEIVLGLEEIFIDFDRIELVRINKEDSHEYIYVLDENTFTADTRKNALLLMCIYMGDDIKEDVKALFKC